MLQQHFAYRAGLSNALPFLVMNRTEKRQKIRRERFAELRARYKTNAAFSNDLGEGFSPSYVSQLLSGHRGIGDEVAEKIEESLSLSEGFLDDVLAIPADALPVVQPSRKVWVIGNGQGGVPDRIWGDSDYPAGASDKYAEVATNDPHAFIVAVRGDSMEPRFLDGEYALVSPSAEANPKHDVLVRLKGGETLLKRLIDLRGGVRLGSYNSPDVLTYPFEEIVWVYRVLHAMPEDTIKLVVDEVAEQADYTVRAQDRRRSQMPLPAGFADRRKKP